MPPDAQPPLPQTLRARHAPRKRLAPVAQGTKWQRLSGDSVRTSEESRVAVGLIKKPSQAHRGARARSTTGGLHPGIARGIFGRSSPSAGISASVGMPRHKAWEGAASGLGAFAGLLQAVRHNGLTMTVGWAIFYGASLSFSRLPFAPAKRPSLKT